MKVQSGMRVDKLVFDRFKGLCKGERLMVGEAVQCLMELCVEAGSVAKVLTLQVREMVGQRKADELKLQGALAMLKFFISAVEEEEWYITIKDKGTRIDQAIYRPAYDTAVATLPKIKDPQLIQETEQVLKKANQSVQKIIG